MGPLQKVGGNLLRKGARWLGPAGLLGSVALDWYLGPETTHVPIPRTGVVGWTHNYCLAGVKGSGAGTGQDAYCGPQTDKGAYGNYHRTYTNLGWAWQVDYYFQTWEDHPTIPGQIFLYSDHRYRSVWQYSNGQYHPSYGQGELDDPGRAPWPGEQFNVDPTALPAINPGAHIPMPNPGIWSHPSQLPWYNPINPMPGGFPKPPPIQNPWPRPDPISPEAPDVGPRPDPKPNPVRPPPIEIPISDVPDFPPVPVPLAPPGLPPPPWEMGEEGGETHIRPRMRGRPKQNQRKHHSRKPEKGKKESKVRMKPWLAKVWYGIGTVTEGNDFINVLYESLDFRVKQREYFKRGRQPNPVEKVRIIYENINDLDTATALRKYIENDIEDKVFGFFGGQLGQASFGRGGPVGYGAGPAL